jgi:hypothetical protein
VIRSICSTREVRVTVWIAEGASTAVGGVRVGRFGKMLMGANACRCSSQGSRNSTLRASVMQPSLFRSGFNTGCDTAGKFALACCMTKRPLSFNLFQQMRCVSHTGFRVGIKRDMPPKISISVISLIHAHKFYLHSFAFGQGMLHLP